MSHGYERTQRVADLIKHEIANLLVKEVRDPRFAFVSINEVEVSKDYSHAKIFITILDESKMKETLDALNKASGFFRYRLAHLVKLRSTPELHFFYDESVARGQRVSELLQESGSPDTPPHKE